MTARSYAMKGKPPDAVTRLTADLMHAWVICSDRATEQPDWADRFFTAAVVDAFKRHRVEVEAFETSLRSRVGWAFMQQSGVTAAILIMHRKPAPQAELTEAEVTKLGQSIFGPSFAFSVAPDGTKAIGTASEVYGFVPVVRGATWRQCFALYLAKRSKQLRHNDPQGADDAAG